MKRSASIEGKLAAKGAKIAKRFLQWLVYQSAAPIATTAYRKLLFSKQKKFRLLICCDLSRTSTASREPSQEPMDQDESK